MGRYSKATAETLLPLIRQICSQRSTNGYHRVTAHLNRQLKGGECQVHPKRIYRIMKLNHLLLTKSGGENKQRSHTGTMLAVN